MREVRVNRENLLTALKENRAKHIADYKGALEGYQIELKEKLEEALSELSKPRSKDFSLRIQAPVSHEKDYDKAICMAEWAQTTEIVLTENEFEHYVMDSWDWKDNFAATSTFYNNKRLL